MNLKIFIGLVIVDDITIEGAEVTKSLREDAGQEAPALQAQEVPGHIRQDLGHAHGIEVETDISQGKNEKCNLQEYDLTEIYTE